MRCSVNRKHSLKPFWCTSGTSVNWFPLKPHHFVSGLLCLTSEDGCQHCTGEMKAISHLGSVTEKHKLLISPCTVNQQGRSSGKDKVQEVTQTMLYPSLSGHNQEEDIVYHFSSIFIIYLAKWVLFHRFSTLEGYCCINAMMYVPMYEMLVVGKNLNGERALR